MELNKIYRMHGTSFDWLTWTGGSIVDLGIPCRKEIIINKREILRKYVIGWCPGGETLCRSKPNEIAVYCLKNGREFWFHMRKDEFEIVFGGQYET
jgi:hypothetical protein